MCELYFTRFSLQDYLGMPIQFPELSEFIEDGESGTYKIYTKIKKWISALEFILLLWLQNLHLSFEPFYIKQGWYSLQKWFSDRFTGKKENIK